MNKTKKQNRIDEVRKLLNTLIDDGKYTRGSLAKRLNVSYFRLTRFVTNRHTHGNANRNFYDDVKARLRLLSGSKNKEEQG